MASSSKSRQPRLRASCDGCFLAKVKCSKARPICSRCLACGIECRYSPSSRAGKPKSDSHHHGHGHSTSNHQDMGDEKNMVYAAPHMQQPEHLFKLESGWDTPPLSVDGSMSRNTSTSTGLSLLGVDERSMGEHDHMSAPPEMYTAPLPWTPPTDLFCASNGEMPPTMGHMPGPNRSHSFEMPMAHAMGWSDPVGHDLMAYSQMTTPSSMSSTNFYPSPNSTPSNRPRSSRHRSSPPAGAPGACICFTVCLQSLQALHNASTPVSPPFDFVLSLNRKAVEACGSMLACPNCMSRSGTHTAAMLLSTLIGKISSFYRNASPTYYNQGLPTDMSNHSSPSGNFGVSFGIYQLNGEDGRWLEQEILVRELRKLEEVYARFRDVCAELSDDVDVSTAVIGYLQQNLGSTLEVINNNRKDMVFAQ